MGCGSGAETGGYNMDLGAVKFPIRKSFINKERGISARPRDNLQAVEEYFPFSVHRKISALGI